MFVFAMYQAKIQKHQAFEAEVAAHANAIQVLDQTGNEMIGQQHFASETIRVRQCWSFLTICVDVFGTRFLLRQWLNTMNMNETVVAFCIFLYF